MAEVVQFPGLDAESVSAALEAYGLSHTGLPILEAQVIPFSQAVIGAEPPFFSTQDQCGVVSQAHEALRPIWTARDSHNSD